MNHTKIEKQTTRPSTVTIERKDLDSLMRSLSQSGYEIVGPTFKHGVIVIDTISASKDLPVGWTEKQEAGTYRTAKRKDDALLGFTVGAHSWKRFLHPPVFKLWQTSRTGKQLEIDGQGNEKPRLAFFGVRSCDLSAIRILDKVFQTAPYIDPSYVAARKNAFIVAVNCTQAGNTCFCASMGTGPKAKSGFDLALTEILDGNRHFFVVEIGSDRGHQILKGVPHEDTADKDLKTAERLCNSAATHMGRKVDTEKLAALLLHSADHPRWSTVAQRCLTCTNCTMVCPTCFCTTVEDTTDLAGQTAERWKKWDSCFTLDFSYIHGGSVRTSVLARYRQWLTHKFASWQEQFGSFGCVGCGRCITWCPVGIDVTEEIRAIRETEHHPSTTLSKE